MKPPWLIFDCNNVAYRAWATTGKLDGGVAYGFLRQVQTVQDRFQSDRLVFCFDGTWAAPNVRRRLSPTYKPPKTFASEEDRNAHEAYRAALRELRDGVLGELGHRNVFWQAGYEADDVIASVVKHSLGGEDAAIIVSSDHDLFQLLGSAVSQWLPHKKELYSAADLERDYGVDTAAWPDVMTLAGCPGDGVIGLRGVGIKTAAKYLAKMLRPGKAKSLIETDGWRVMETNLPLVVLPFPGINTFVLREDRCTPSKRRAVLKRLGFASLLGNL